MISIRFMIDMVVSAESTDIKTLYLLYFSGTKFGLRISSTSIGQKVLLYFVSTVLQHVSHVLSNLFHHTVNSPRTSNTLCQTKNNIEHFVKYL